MKIAAFHRGSFLTLRPYPNGGWAIEAQSSHPGEMNDKLGAYSHAEDMIDALSEALIDPPDSED